MDLQIVLYFSAASLRSVLLARDQGPAPAASVTHPGRQRSGRGGITRAGKRTPRLFRLRCLQQRQQQLFLLVGRKVELSAPIAWIQLSSPCTLSRLPTLTPITHPRSSSELHTRLPALCPLLPHGLSSVRSLSRPLSSLGCKPWTSPSWISPSEGLQGKSESILRREVQGSLWVSIRKAQQQAA